MLDLETLQTMIKPMFPGLMGVQLLEVTPERVVAEMEVRPDLCTGGGILHGGAYMAFADTLGALGTVVNLPKGKRTTTTDSSTKFISGCEGGQQGERRVCGLAPGAHHDGLANERAKCRGQALRSDQSDANCSGCLIRFVFAALCRHAWRAIW